MPGGADERSDGRGAAAPDPLLRPRSCSPRRSLAPAEDGERMKLLRMLNESRDRHDLRALRPGPSLNRDAMRHTHRMLRRNQSSTRTTLPGCSPTSPGTRWARASSVCEHVEASPPSPAATRPHRRILLHPRASAGRHRRRRGRRATPAGAGGSGRPSCTTADPPRDSAACPGLLEVLGRDVLEELAELLEFFSSSSPSAGMTMDASSSTSSLAKILQPRRTASAIASDGRDEIS